MVFGDILVLERANNCGEGFKYNGRVHESIFELTGYLVERTFGKVAKVREISFRFTFKLQTNNSINGSETRLGSLGVGEGTCSALGWRFATRRLSC